ncbi:small nuclear ribonucleoprotein G-like [Prionailurus viverrinus]|uniref:small nuclear ribonucleoprotein G-like n=1 Tax=Prionailurus bengalensis TaxID=37029 RepID=UPI001CA8B1D6|nr:small nuclear ribonucleoprotein G-like [Prionailurus bengalensis]XP_047721381.1 small nuclear ribonucleoprotein G-like [Prionailurus viverrinus]
MRKSHPHKLKKFIDKKLSLKLNGGKHVQEILWEFNPFMNLVIDECVEMATSGQQNNTRMVTIRRNTIIMLETLALEWSINNSCVHQKKSTVSTCPLCIAPVLLQYKNQIMCIFILNFFVK